MARPSLFGAAAALLLALAPAAASAQSAAPDQTVLKASGAELPERIGDFTRVGISSVEPGRLGASYRNGGDALVDIFIARSVMTVEEELAGTEGMIGRVFSDLRAVRDLPAPAAAPTAKGRLWTGVSGSGPVYTLMMIDRREGWRIKIRGTVAQAQGEAGVAAIEKLVRDYGWWREDGGR
jgi:hypothetical protein